MLKFKIHVVLLFVHLALFSSRVSSWYLPPLRHNGTLIALIFLCKAAHWSLLRTVLCFIYAPAGIHLRVTGWLIWLSNASGCNGSANLTCTQRAMHPVMQSARQGKAPPPKTHAQPLFKQFRFSLVKRCCALRFIENGSSDWESRRILKTFRRPSKGTSGNAGNWEKLGKVFLILLKSSHL